MYCAYSMLFDMDIVITGVSGKFPASDNVYELRDNLFNKIDMVSGDDRRWTKFHPEIPQRSGKINGINDFDAGFFGITKTIANFMDPSIRIVLEKVYEAMLDSGYHPYDFENEKSGVYVGAAMLDGGLHNVQKRPVNAEAIARCTKLILANSICYYYKLNGAAMVIDSSCSSSFSALDAAYQDVRRGKCNKAIVCGLNLCLDAFGTLQHARLGILSADGSCKSFDDAGNGYVRADTAVAIILERASAAKRIYAELVHCKSLCDGFKEEGITFPSSAMQKALLKEFYEECKVDPRILTFMEAHATGTKVGDPEELDALSGFFLKNRDKPLHIGSVKSNIGHSETASGLCSVVKVIIGMEAGFIPPNINYFTPRKGVKDLERGMFKVVDEKIPWPEDDVYVGIKNSGFGGTNSHVLLHWNTKEKIMKKCGSDMPKLICVSGRTEEAVMKIFEDVSKRDIDVEFIKLIHQIYRKPIFNNPYLGYTIFGGNVETESTVVKKSISETKLCVIFAKFDKNCSEIHESLKIIPKYSSLLKDIENILRNETELSINGTQENVIQLILANILKGLNISGIVKGIGCEKRSDIVAAYFNNVITFRQAVLELSNPSTFNFINFNQIQMEVNTTFLIVGDRAHENQTDEKIILINSNKSDYLNQLLKSLGNLYLKGFSHELDQIYPEIRLPVSRGTPMLSPLVKWDHRRSYYSYKFNSKGSNHFGESFVHVNSKDITWKHFKGHKIDATHTFPPAECLFLAWETFCSTMRKKLSETPVVLEDVKFLRTANIAGASETLPRKVAINQRNNTFVIMVEDTVLVTGKIYLSESEEITRIDQIVGMKEVFMERKDVYKELMLRGYEYQDECKAIERSDILGRTAIINWNDNWSMFMDNMLQLYSLHRDTRNFGGGMEISGFGATIIDRREPVKPALQIYKFVPYEGQLEKRHAVRCMVQMIMENGSTTKVKSVEVLRDSDDWRHEPITPLVQQALADLPLVQANLKVLSKRKEMSFGSEIVVEDSSLDTESECLIVIARDVLQNPELLSVALQVTRGASGFVMSLCSKAVPIQTIPQIQVLSCYETEEGRMLLIKEPSQYMEKIPVRIHNDLSWLKPLQAVLSEKVILYSQNIPTNGVLGLVNCLRREALASSISAMIIMDDAPPFNIDDPFFKSQLDKNLAINIFKDGQWGSYRYLLLPDVQTVDVEHCYLSVNGGGELSNLRWVEGPLSRNTIPEADSELVDVHYSSINIRDVMAAPGTVSVDVTTKNRISQECIRGFEFSGKLIGVPSKRVMGLQEADTLSTLVIADSKLLWTIPDEWSLEEAVTVPVAYGTALYAFIKRGRMKFGQSVLVHSGAGGIGQAAINVASHLGCTIYTTVDTEQKRDFIKTHFPQIKSEHIGDSRSTSFEEMIRTETKGRGVDFVLNSLSGEKLQASVRCLAYKGTFLQIGMDDLMSDNQLATTLLRKQARYEGIVLHQLFAEGSKEILTVLIMEGINSGAVKPLERTVFCMDEIQGAARYMTTGEDIGKVLVKVRDESNKGHNKLFKAIPRVICSSLACYIIVGGLGGFGLELADWLVTRGAKCLVLISRSGETNGYQYYRLNTLKSYGVNVVIRNDDIGSESSCASLLNFAEVLGPVEGIFNLAVVLKDGLFENHTAESFKTSFLPKSLATQHLDAASRKHCPHLKYFVVFSSMSSGMGYPGQTNYGMANSEMEMVCEKRKMDGYPALVIQWGHIGDVGITAEMKGTHKEYFKRGVSEQKIFSCLQCLDQLIRQNEPLVSSMVVADKKTRPSGDTAIQSVLNIIGLTDLKAVSLYRTFPEMGLDSLLVLEVKHILEREYKISLTIGDIRNMTLARLLSLGENTDKNQSEDE